MFRFDGKISAPIVALLLLAASSPLHAQSTPAVVSVTSSQNPATYASPLTFTITVASPLVNIVAVPPPTGTVIATLPGPYNLGSATLDGAGRAVISVPQRPGLFAAAAIGLGAGANDIAFSYSGDTRYKPAESKFTQWIDKANSTTVASVAGSSLPVRFTATVSIDEPSVTTIPFVLPGNLTSSAPTGMVKFYNGTTLLGSATLTPSGLFTSTASIGSDPVPANLTAVYVGDDNYNGSTSAGTGGGGGGAASLTASASANPATFAEPVTFNVAVSPALAGAPIPTGTVSANFLGLFGLGSVTLNSKGQGSLTVPMNSISAVAATVPWGLPAGPDSVTLVYNGDANYAATKVGIAELVNKATTTTTATLAPASNTGIYSVSAAVTNSEPSVTPLAFALPGDTAGSTSPTGIIQFLNGSTVIGTAVLSPSGHLQSSVTLTLNQPASSTAGIVAVYDGDANYLGSTSPPAILPNRSAVTLAVASSANPSTFAEPVKLSITVGAAAAAGPTPTGTVRASLQGSDVLGSATLDSTGRAVLVVPQDPGATTSLPWGFATGSNVITIDYSGDTNFDAAKNSLTQLVNRADSATSLPPTPGAIGTIAAVVRINQPSVASDGFAIPAAGNLSISPTGNVTYYDGPTLLGTAALTPGGLYQSTAILHIDPSLRPTSVRAVYQGDTNYNGSSSPGDSGGAPVTITLAASANPVIYGAPFTVVATVATATAGSPTPTGTLSFYDGAQNLGAIATLDNSGKGSLQIPIPLATPLVCAPLCLSAQELVLGAGAHVITVRYSGDANYAPSAPSVSVTEQIDKAPSVTTLSTVLSTALPPVPASLVATVADRQPPSGGPVHFLLMGASGLVDGNPSGPVQFFAGTDSIGKAALTPNTSANVTSNAILNYTGATAGLSAAYSGDANFEASSSPSPSTSGVSLTSSANPSAAGQTVTLTAAIVTSSVSPVPTGSVDFVDGSTVLGRALVSGGMATLSATFSTSGMHSLTAIYSGDASFPGASSAAYAQTVLLAGGIPNTLTISAATPTAVYGQQIVFIVGFSGQGNVPPQGAVTLLDGTTPVGGANWDLGAAPIVVLLPVGTHQLSAVWAGDGYWAAGKSGILQEVVNRAATTTTLTADLTITVAAVRPGAGIPTGTVQLVDSGNKAVLATVTLVNGTAKVTTPLTVSDPLTNTGGNDLWEAIYSGDTNFAPSTSAILPAIYNVAGAPTSLLAPDEIAAIYGANLTSSNASNVAVTVKDSAGIGRAAYLYYSSPSQIDFVVPPGTASGPATLSSANFTINVTVQPVAPVLYAANPNGIGVAAAQIVKVHADGSQAIDNVAALNSAGQFQPLPIVFGADSLYLVLYATGVRHNSGLGNVKCSIGGVLFPVTYAGAQPQYPGLDQIVVPLTNALKGTGTANVFVTVDGQVSNTVTIGFQ